MPYCAFHLNDQGSGTALKPADDKARVMTLLLLDRLISRQMRCFAVSVGEILDDSILSVVGFDGQSNRWWMS